MIDVPKTQAQWIDVVLDSQSQDVVLTSDGEPFAVVMSAERHRQLLELLEEALDDLGVG